MYISKLELKQFKRFSEASIDLGSPITVLLGPNSSGKSSIIKAILALKQTASPTNENETLATQGEYVDLGVYRDYVHDHEVESKIELATTIVGDWVGFPIGALKRNSLRIALTLGRDHSTEQARLLELSVSDPSSGEVLLSVIKKKTRDTFLLSMPEPVARVYLKALLREDDAAIEVAQKAWNLGLSVRVDDRYVIAREVRESDGSRSRTHLELLLYLARGIVDLFLRGLDKDFFYLGPLRRSPSRSYARTGHLLSVGPAGEHTPSVLANLKARAAKERSAQPVQRMRLNQFREWMQALFPGRPVEAKSLDELVKLVISRSSAHGDTISDVGFGISQILPILVQIAVMPDRTTLLIEQPELHLHPSLQTKLAEVLVIASKSGRRFVIETHSEHLVRGLQLAISNDRVKARVKSRIPREDVRFLYIPAAPDSPVNLEVNEWGEFIQEWPSGFFDEAYRLAMRLLQNKMKSLAPESNSNADSEDQP